MYKKLTVIFTLFMIIIGLFGCVEEKTGINEVIIQGKGEYSTIQNAIDSAMNGDTIIVSSGTYVEMLSINKSIVLTSENNEKPILYYSGNKTGVSMIRINSGNCTISGFQIIGNNQSDGLSGIDVSSSNNKIINNLIEDVHYGLNIKNSNNNMVNNNLIRDNEHGIYMSQASENNVSNNNITGNHLYGIYALSQSDSNIFTRNRISLNNYGVRIKGATDNRFFKNIVINNVFKGIYLCCGSMNNLQYKNNIINNTKNADDRYSNVWYFNNSGNYWDDYEQSYPDAVDQDDDGIWDTPYTVYEEKKDIFPAVKPYEFF